MAPLRLSVAAFSALVLTVALSLAGCSSGGSGSTPVVQNPAITLNPTSLTFTTQPLATTSAQQSITVTDSGNGPLTITSITVTGDFSQTNTCTAANVSAGSTCGIQVTFTPTGTGTRTGSLTINSNVSGSPVTATLTGTGALAAITLNPTSLTFTNQQVSTASSPQSITVTDTGASPLIVSSISIGGDYTQTNNCTTAAIAVNAFCTVQVIFAPTVTGTRTGTLTINGNVSGGSSSAALTGGAVTGPSVVLSPLSLTFGQIFLTTASASQTVTVTNNGGTAATLQTPSVSGDFALTANTCSTSLSPAATCSISIDFLPTASGTRTGQLSLTDSSGTQTSSLTGVGVSTPVGTFSGSSFTGKVRAGQAPIVGASVQLYAAGTLGLASQGWPMLATPLTSDANGNFTVSAASYSCPLGTSQVYAVARGGHPASGSGSNSAIELLSPLGLCNQITSSTSVELNEVTTVVSAWAMAQLLSPNGNLGASSTNAVGIANAVATVNSLADLTAGAVPGPSFPANGTAPTARINTLANLLNTCTVAGSPTASACTRLFAAAAPAGALPLTNILDAALSIVTHPGNNVAALYTLATNSTPFSFNPSLTSAPGDWTLFVNYTGGGMNSPSGIGVDSQGNVWVASYFSELSKFSPIGLPIFPSGKTGNGLSASYGLAVAVTDDPWIPNENGSSISVFNSAGTAVADYGGAGLNFPVAVAMDPNTDVWAVNYGNSRMILLSSSGAALSGAAGYTSSAFDFPVAVAVDSNHNAWVANQSDVTIAKVSLDGTQITKITCCNGASGIAVDQGNHAWAANYYGNSVSFVANDGTVLSPTNGITGGGINHPQGIAVDGVGNIWVANFRGPSLSQIAGFNNSVPAGTLLSPANGWAPESVMLEAYAIAIDPTGNLWISDFGSNTVTEFVGLASPIKTPFLGPPQAP